MDYIVKAQQLGVSFPSSGTAGASNASQGSTASSTVSPTAGGAPTHPPGPGRGGPGSGCFLCHLLSCLCGQSYSYGIDLPYPDQKQQQSEWCWAATAAGVDAYYEPGVSHSQCEIAALVTTMPDCCQAPYLYDTAEELDQALQDVQHFSKEFAGYLSFAQTQAELEACRPLCAQIVWAADATSHCRLHSLEFRSLHA
jgi:hypothetical protein